MSARQPAAFAGLLLLAALWLVPLDAAVGRFSLHMLRHMLIVAVIAPLLVIGFPALRVAIAVPPLVAAAFEFVLVWAWHLPGAHGAAYREPGLFALEQGSFLIAGLFVWANCLRAGDAGAALAGAGGLLLTSMHMTLLGTLLVLAPRDLYAEVCRVAPDLSAQQLGGVLMLAIGTPVYLLAGVALAGRALSGNTGTP